jgi:transposase
MEDRQPRNRRQFTAEFKCEAVDLVHSTGRPIAEIARELGLYDSTLGNWVRQARIDRGEGEGLTSEERARLRQLEAENTRLRMERDLRKTNRGLLGQRAVDAVSRSRCVDAQKAAGFSVAAAGQAAGVTRSAYYAWTARRPSQRRQTMPAWSARSAASTPALTVPTARHGSPPSWAGAAGT